MRALARRVWGGWTRIAYRIGHFQSRLLLSIVYFLFLGLFALPHRLLSDPLRLRRQGGTTSWLPREPGPTTTDEARRQ